MQADLKTISALGAYAVTAITCVVAEVPGKVSQIQPIEPRIVAEQIRLLFDAFPVAAVKTGMLYSCEIIAAVADALPAGIPLVVDPVMIATSGDPLLRDDAIALYRERLFPIAKVITPNLDEAGVLLGRPLKSLDEMRIGGVELAAQFGTAILLKGGHLREAGSRRSSQAARKCETLSKCSRQVGRERSRGRVHRADLDRRGFRCVLGSSGPGSSGI